MPKINKIPLLIIVSFLLCSIKDCMAQGVEFNKNAIYASGGSAGLYFSATGY